jgi:GNAT superfamily N-acetyltransferase
MATKKTIPRPARRRKSKRDTAHSMELAHVFLELTTSVAPTWDSHEPENYLTHLSGKVCISSDDSDCIVVGTVSAFSVRLSNALDDGVSWFDVLDSYNDDIALYSALVEPDGSSYTEWVQSKLEPFASDLLILDRIRVDPKFRGKGYGLYAAQLMIQGFGPSGGLVACVPAPYELLQKYQVPSVGEALTMSREDRLPEWKPAQMKLRELWSLLGFEPVPESDVFVLSLALRQPDLRGVIQKYFERKSMPTLPVQ